MKKLLVVILLVITMATVARAETYRWTDNSGTVHFSDSPGEIPAQYRKSLVTGDPDTPSSVGGAAEKAAIGNRSESRRKPAVEQATVAPQVEALKERILNDEGTMALIGALLNDPEMQALLNDPVVMSAVQAGDVAALMNNAAFLRIKNNPRVRAITKRVEGQGSGAR